MPDRLPDAEMWRSVERTLRDVIIPSIGEHDEWARTAAVQLAGLARYASTRPGDMSHERATELRSLLTELAGNDLVPSLADDAGDAELFAAAGRALASAVGRSDAAADEIRARLRPVLVRQLDDELVITGPLIRAFRGRLDE